MQKSEEVTKPCISEETKREMIKFFMKTSFPRILAEKKLAANKISEVKSNEQMGNED